MLSLYLDRYYSSNQNLITRVQELASAKEVWFRAGSDSGSHRGWAYPGSADYAGLANAS